MDENAGNHNPRDGAPPEQTARRRFERTRGRVEAVSQRSQAWVERQHPGTRKGVAIGAWRRYQAVDGPLQSALLSLYVLVAILPALLVMEAYFDSHPGALANHLTHHYGLSAPTASLLRAVLSEDRKHELGAALLAIASALFFGLGFGRVLQLVHTRAWGLALPRNQTDQALYAGVLLGLYGLILLLLVQLKELRGSPSWVGNALALGWVGLLVLFFVWAPWLLSHKLVTRRDLLPGAVLTALGLVVLMLISSFVMEFWVNLYAKDYGGFGVVLAIYFWIVFSSAIIVWAASLPQHWQKDASFAGFPAEPGLGISGRRASSAPTLKKGTLQSTRHYAGSPCRLLVKVPQRVLFPNSRSARRVHRVERG